jgi:hypothetical protein
VLGLEAAVAWNRWGVLGLDYATAGIVRVRGVRHAIVCVVQGVRPGIPARRSARPTMPEGIVEAPRFTLLQVFAKQKPPAFLLRALPKKGPWR